ncbi:MAG: phosphatidylglycerophosphatase A [Alphaproteobacteria bacterium]|jgi:phosphatidylglycerophosphatase A|nr:phosphatidylglycerophosphatase A [Alphaproteobacteria bacterium]MDP6659966.1 phosphatidylglycerophosphatase A [Alphaproteobacteria bacterium]MDP6780142.1 phosphatidylglycerophosphatase A [Alphaproteobacteria bacterium]MDP7044669.1 phosphatidylglycerophosphatase A [Alphaproteobacteria bacterium]
MMDPNNGAANSNRNTGSSLPGNLSLSDPAVLLATWFGSGLIRKAPGTWGSLAALPCAWLVVRDFGTWGLTAAIVLVFLCGWWAASRIEAKTGTSDPQYIVIDEVAGQGLALLFVPLDLYLYLVGFLLFRFFDILKPWPLHAMETRLKGGLGVMADDLAAGAYTALLLYIFYILKQMVIDVFKGIA